MFRMFLLMGYSTRLCDLESFFMNWDSRPHRFHYYSFFALCKFFLHSFCWVLLCVFWAWILVIFCNWVVSFCLHMVYHSRYFYIMFCMCGDNMVVGTNIGAHDKLIIKLLYIECLYFNVQRKDSSSLLCINF